MKSSSLLLLSWLFFFGVTSGLGLSVASAFLGCGGTLPDFCNLVLQKSERYSLHGNSNNTAMSLSAALLAAALYRIAGVCSFPARIAKVACAAFLLQVILLLDTTTRMMRLTRAIYD